MVRSRSLRWREDDRRLHLQGDANTPQYCYGPDSFTYKVSGGRWTIDWTGGPSISVPFSARFRHGGSQDRYQEKVRFGRERSARDSEEPGESVARLFCCTACPALPEPWSASIRYTMLDRWTDLVPRLAGRPMTLPQRVSPRSMCMPTFTLFSSTGGDCLHGSSDRPMLAEFAGLIESLAPGTPARSWRLLRDCSSMCMAAPQTIVGRQVAAR